MFGRGKHRRSRRPRRVPLLWGSSALAALILILGASGTLSSWASAIITNDSNTVATAQAVILEEAKGTTTCFSSSVPSTNSSTCSTINKYGGTATPLTPGTNQQTDVTFTNAGGANATSFVLTPGSCTQVPAAGTGTPAAANACTNGDLTVAVSCTDGATYGATPWVDLAYAAGAPPTATKTRTATAGDLNAAASWTCRFTVALSATASVLDQGITVSQPLTWTLNK